MPGYVADYIKEQEHDKEQEREWHERETERIPSWMDEERITAERYEEGPQERESGPRIRAW
jgi:hypothetical protein